MLRRNGYNSPEACCKRRRKRIQLRRSAAVMVAGGESSSLSPGVHLGQRSHSIVTHREQQQVGSSTNANRPLAVDSVADVTPPNEQQGGSTALPHPLSSSSGEDPDEAADRNMNHVPGVVSPVVGAVAVAGRLQIMEDAVTVHTNLCSPPINQCRPIHYLGVFDGHGGPHVAVVCRDWMHVILEEELMHLKCPELPSASGASSSRAPALGQPDVECILKYAWTKVFERCFSRTEELVMNFCGCGCLGVEYSFDRNQLVYSGSTAVVVVLTDEYIIAANCGDSRAILCCNGSVIPLSDDHKPDRPDERARIVAGGGCILVSGGVPRVGGILSLSRAVGDEYLKPHVVSVPEITFIRRTSEQQTVILASDGLWNVMSNEMTCHVVKECVKEVRSTENERPRLGPSQCAMAAGLLTNLAFVRGSTDNISVVVADLKRTVMTST